MGKALNIRDIGEKRKHAIIEEARERGIPMADLVREFIDSGLETSRRNREREVWMREAAPGIQAEQRFLETHGVTLARYRIGSGRVDGGSAAQDDAAEGNGSA